MKRITIVLLSILFVSLFLSCAKKSVDTATSNKIDLSNFAVENRITSSMISNKILDIIDKKITSWLGNEIIVDSINAANRDNATRSQEDIDKTDDAWKNNDTALINSYLDDAPSAFLKKIADNSGGLFKEIFIMDFQGCLVGLSHQTSDFWQGDEDKFQISYNKGKGRVFIDNIELDASTQARLVQISLPVLNPADQRVIGAVTIGVDINKL